MRSRGFHPWSIQKGKLDNTSQALKAIDVSLPIPSGPCLLNAQN
jgi:hypothetical protein